MPDSEKNRPLTNEEKQKIYLHIYSIMEDFDRKPHEIIKKDYSGNEDAYLRMMAKWLKIPL